MAVGRANTEREPFGACISRIERAFESAGVKARPGIVTSRDETAARLTRLLTVKDMPVGFRKWQLPVYHKGPTHLFVTVAEAGAKVAPHNHEGDSTRFVVSGSIIVAGKELTAGDWMFIPARTNYSFEVGGLGAVMAAGYEC